MVGAQTRFGSRTTCIVKKNMHLFPMQALHAVLRAHYGDRPAGHWLVFETTILEVKLMAVVYVWSQRGLLYFISTDGSTELHDKKYLSSFKTKLEIFLSKKSIVLSLPISSTRTCH
jgi:hypothetical protein